MSEESESKWRRPASVPFPSIWSRFERKDPKDSTVIRKFRIQDVTEDIVPPLIHLMRTSLILEEPMLQACKVASDPMSFEEFTELYKEIMKQKISLVCLEEGPDGDIIRKDGVPVVAGFNALFVSAKGESEDIPEVEGAALIRFFKVFPLIMQGIDILEKYSVNAYMSAAGLSVAPKYRGLGIGLEILKSRDQLARAVGIEMISTIFSAEISQALAARAGYEVIAEKNYEEIERKYPDISFSGTATKSGKYMVKKIQR